MKQSTGVINMQNDHRKAHLPRQVPRYYQYRDDNACGAVCIKMVLDYFWKPSGRRVSRQDFHKILHITLKGDRYLPRGTYREHLTAALIEFGISATKISGDTETRLKQITKALRKGCPVILTCIEDFGSYGWVGHYIVLTGIDKDFIYINDPYPGKDSQIALLSFLKNGQPLSWDNSKWGIILRESR